MRIGLVIYGSLDTLSGGYLYDRQLVTYLRARGDEVVIYSQRWGSYAARLAGNLDRRLEERLARERLDFLLQDELNHPSLFWLNRRLRARISAPLVAIVHHLLSSERLGVWRGMIRQVERAYLRSVDGFVFNSQTTRASVEGLLGRGARGLVAYPGGDQFASQAGRPPNNAHSHYGSEDDLRFLFAGNLIPRKGLHTLLRALALLPPSGWRLDIVGQDQVDPAYTRLARRLAAPLGSRVCFHGRLDDAAFRRVWQASHVLVVPSTYEGFGIVYLEGMAFGLPVVASTAGAAAEIITHGENGYLVPPEQPQALAEVLSGLLANPVRLADLSTAARRRFDRHPTWQQSMASIRDFLLGWQPTGSR